MKWPFKFWPDHPFEREHQGVFCSNHPNTKESFVQTIVIFLTMLFNATIEAMKYHLLLEAADVQNDKGFYPQVDTLAKVFDLSQNVNVCCF